MLKEAILEAAEKAGGDDGIVGYLQTQAKENAGPFMALLGKVLPMQMTGAGGGPIEIITKAQRDAAVAAATRADS